MNAKTFRSLVSAVTMLWCGWAVEAALYNVDRSWTDGVNSASLIGTVEIPLGSYSIMNQGSSPFTDIDLTLSINSVPVSLTLNYVDTSIIGGTGEFLIEATPLQLIFGVANANSVNPADLGFRNDSGNFPRYLIGADGNPGFESADELTLSVLADVNLSGGLVFGTISTTPVPDSGSLLVGFSLTLGVMAWAARRERAWACGRA